MLQCVAVRCSVLQCVAVCCCVCSVLLCVAAIVTKRIMLRWEFETLSWKGSCCVGSENSRSCVAVRCSVLQCVAVCCCAFLCVVAVVAKRMMLR